MKIETLHKIKYLNVLKILRITRLVATDDCIINEYINDDMIFDGDFPN